MNYAKAINIKWDTDGDKEELNELPEKVIIPDELEEMYKQDREDGYQDYSEWWHECEIIGNIFDDQELLEA